MSDKDLQLVTVNVSYIGQPCWPLTCGLRNSESPTSDNLTSQETTNQADIEVGTDGAELSCPGSSVVADEHEG